MAVNLIFDSSNVTTPIDGTKTLAQLGLTDAQNVSSFIGGKLRVTGAVNGYASNYVVPTGYNGLYPDVTCTFDSATIGAASPLILMRVQDEINNPRPSRNASDSICVSGELWQPVLQLMDDSRHVGEDSIWK